MLPLRTLVSLVTAAASIALASCGGDTPTQPTTLSITSITPASGSTLGGLKVTITGANFSAGATVSLGDAAATDVTVAGPTMLTATTGQRAAAVVDVVVTAGGSTARLPGGFTYAAPSAATNTPPVILSVSARGSRADEPAQFADLDEEINVTATVQDAETALSQLTYEWTSSSGGVFSGNGPSVRWRAPQSASTPLTATLTLTVIERYSSVDANGLPVTRENRVSRATSIGVHASKTEVADMARQFLLDFSDSNIQDVSYILRNFTDVGFCAAEKASEAIDVARNRREKRITASRVDTPAVSVTFQGTCPIRDRRGDACALVNVEWQDVSLVGDPPGHVKGTDQVSAVYVATQNRWALCGSDFVGLDMITGLRVTRMP
jgi:hypothetical protein